jgi:hypothetical protein
LRLLVGTTTLISLSVAAFYRIIAQSAVPAPSAQ